MDIGGNIRALRRSRKMTLEELATELTKSYPDGINFNKGKLSKWENNKEEPKLSSIKSLADYFNVTVDDLYRGNLKSNIDVIYNKLTDERQNNVIEFAEHQLNEQIDYGESPTVYLHGQTAAGAPITYGDLSYETVSANVPKGADGALLVRGDSMEPLIADNSIIFYKEQPYVENGEVAIVELDGSEVTCKKFYFNGQDVILKSINNQYEDMVVNEGVRIIGKVIL